jgi:hypothetical protein
MRALPGRWGREGGALSPKAPRARCGRLGDPALPEACRGLGAAGSEIGGLPEVRRALGMLAYRVAAQVAAVVRGWLGILRGWELGSLGDGDL